jgi:putative salt-induced outer membrane protein YdiY
MSFKLAAAVHHACFVKRPVAMSLLSFVSVLFISLLLVALPARSATLILDNGDQLTGTVVRLEGNNLRFRTAYAGVVTVDWRQVRQLTTDQDVTLLTNDQRILEGRITASPDAGFQIETGAGESIQAEETMVASVNPEDWEIGRAAHWTGEVNASLKLDRGNSDKDEIDFDGLTTRRRKNDRLEFRGEIEYDRSLGTTTKQKWLASGKYDYFVSKKQYYSFSATAEHDEFKGLNLRYHLGPAIGYQFYEESRRNLRGEIGLYYSSSDLDTTGRKTSLATGWLIDADYTFDNANVSAYHWQNMILSNPENMNFKSRTGLRIPLGGGFLGSAEVEANWDAETADATDKTELIYRFKLGYGW